MSSWFDLGGIATAKAQSRPHINKISTITWQLLAKFYTETLIDDAKGYYHRVTIKRHFMPFFSKFTDVTLITSASINDYGLYRRRKANTEPLPQTLNRENTVFRQMLRCLPNQPIINTVKNGERLRRWLSARTMPQYFCDASKWSKRGKASVSTGLTLFH